MPYKTRRDLTALETFEKVNHNLTSKGYTKKTKAKKLFAYYKNSSCILTPEVTQGPYWITGEPIRTNVRRKQAGVPVHLEYQFMSVAVDLSQVIVLTMYLATQALAMPQLACMLIRGRPMRRACTRAL